ncbi:MAG: hypothetical protein U0935_01215 [Pirellulales bacterium]
MGFLKRLFGNPPSENSPAPADFSSFDQLTEEEMQAHLGITRYGDFVLTQAIRPSFDLRVTPRQGYRRDIYRDQNSRSEIPVLMASASAERLFDLFLDLLAPLGDEVDVVLETSHHRDHGGHHDYYCKNKDTLVVKSQLCGYEDLLLNDGCTGIAVLNPDLPQEVQFDEHKLLIVYGNPLYHYEQIFRRYGIPRIDDIKFVTEAEHVHSSNDEYAQQFEQLMNELWTDE